MKIGPLPKGAKVLPTTHQCQKPHIIFRGIEHKHCSYCDEWKPLSEFWAHAAHNDGLQCHCKACVSTLNMNDYHKRGKK